MKITVQFTTQLKAALGMAETTIDLPPNANVQAMISCLDKEHSPTFRQFALDQNGRFLPSLIICINDQQCSGDVLQQPLTDGDQVALVSAISGG